MSRRHAYLQVVGGRPFCVDLGSRTGTLAEDGTPAGGWLDPDRPIRIGPYRIRAKVDGTARPDGPAGGPDPLSIRDVVPDPWPRATLTFERQGGPAAITIARTLSLVGRSPRCKIRLATPEASRFHAALLRTPDGTWAVDLRSTGRLSVNGDLRDHARLEAGDEIRSGPLVARVGGPSTPPGRARVPSIIPGVVGSPAIPRLPEPPTGDLRAIVDLFADIQHQSNDQVRQAIVMVTQMFGSMHRETMDLIREELEQIRNLAGELKAFREESAAGGAVESATATGRKEIPRDPGEKSISWSASGSRPSTASVGADGTSSRGSFTGDRSPPCARSRPAVTVIGRRSHERRRQDLRSLREPARAGVRHIAITPVDEAGPVATPPLDACRECARSLSRWIDRGRVRSHADRKPRAPRAEKKPARRGRFRLKKHQIALAVVIMLCLFFGYYLSTSFRE